MQAGRATGAGSASPSRVKTRPLRAPARIPLRLDKPPCSQRSCPVFPEVSIRRLTRGTAQRCADSSLEGRLRRRYWPSRRISPPPFDFPPFCSIGPSSAPPYSPRPNVPLSLIHIWSVASVLGPRLPDPLGFRAEPLQGIFFEEAASF